MRDFVELIVGAMASGSVYALVALSYLLITRPTGVINFAVGEWSRLCANTNDGNCGPQLQQSWGCV
ncbi:MAG TPA: hypothetical protein PLT77_14350, partial [Burkholderiaceae bacterium]|nr:hypothetical protein [Burkholderiaceae bacterium]